MKLTRRILNWFALMLMLSFLVANLLLTLDVFRIDSIDYKIEGASSAEWSKSLRQQMASFENRNIWSVALSDLLNIIYRDNWVDHVRIQRVFPSRLTVEIDLKTAPLILKDNKSNNANIIAIAEDGALIVSPYQNFARPPLVLQGNEFKDDLDLRLKAVSVAKVISGSTGLKNLKYESLSWNHDDGFILNINSPQIKVVLGEDRVQLKLSRVAQILDYLKNHDMNVRIIDASSPKKILVRLYRGP